MMDSLFQLPDEVLFTTLSKSFPCREPQIRALSTLLHPNAAPCRNLVIHGTEATGKSAITDALLDQIADPSQLKYAVVNSIECITARHLFERAIGKVADAMDWERLPPRCESVAQFTTELARILKYPERPPRFRFVLVFDSIDRQREAPPTLLPALGRLSEIIPCLTTVFIVTAPAANQLRTTAVPHVQFPNYTRGEFITILCSTKYAPETLATTSPEDTTWLWHRFVDAVHDALIRTAARTLPSLVHACQTLWPRITASILAGAHGPREFNKLMIKGRVLFQDESLLDPGIISMVPGKASAAAAATTASTPQPQINGTNGITTKTKPPAHDLTTLLPTTPRLLLIAAYLASHNAARHDLTLFSTYHHGRRRRRGGLSVAGAGGARRGKLNATKHRKIARKLLGAHAFVLERMLAIFAAVRGEWTADPKRGKAANGKGKGKGKGKGVAIGEDGEMMPGGVGVEHGVTMDADVGAAVATLASLRLLVRVGVGGGDLLDRAGKWRVNVGWEVVRALGRGMGIEVEEWLIE